MENREKKSNLNRIIIIILALLFTVAVVFFFAVNAKERERLALEKAALKESAILAASLQIDNQRLQPVDGEIEIFYAPDDSEVIEADGAKGEIEISSLIEAAERIKGEGELYAKVYEEDQLIFEGSLLDLGEVKSAGGQYLLEIQQDLNENSTKYTGKPIYRLEMTYAPSLEFITEGIPSEFLQGDMLLLDAQGVDGATIETDLPIEVTFYENVDKYTAIVPFSYTLAPNTYFVKATKDGESVQFSFEVGEREFVKQHITVSQDVTNSTINSQAANKEFADVMNPAKALSDPVLYITEPFAAPLKGRISTQFGMQRYVNNAKNPTRHSGIDIAGNRTGTPIVASNRGRVIVAQMLQLTGNTVVIEHGFGLKTIYYHMDEISVAVDDMVELGQQVGTVGNTGFSTGPHLHFSMSVNNVWIKPLYDYE